MFYIRANQIRDHLCHRAGGHGVIIGIGNFAQRLHPSQRRLISVVSRLEIKAWATIKRVAVRLVMFATAVDPRLELRP